MHSAFFPYDKGIFDRVHSLYDECIFASPEEHFKVNAKQHEGKVVLPFIGIWRMPDFNIETSLANDSFLRTGWRTYTINKNNSDIHAKRNDKDNRKAMHGLPVTLQYQIDVYATKRDVCDGLTAELVIEFRSNPYLNVQIYDMGEYFMQVNMDLDESISDNSDIGSFDETNRFYRMTMNLQITDAPIFRVDDFSKVDKVYVDIKSLLGDSSDLDNSVSLIDKPISYTVDHTINKAKLDKD